MILPSESSLQKPAEIRKIRRYALIGAVLWTLLLFGLFVAYVVDNRDTIREIGRSMAQASFEKDVLYRRWAARHGGVYVPETPASPANPYLSHIPERDITTPSGRRLTLVNPAYMMRQVFELAREDIDIPQGHITSLNPIRAENAPDAWETKALKSLEQGAKEVVERVELNGQPHLRFMRPLMTEKPCLRCHAVQGYKEGDGRGGISVTLSLVAIQNAMNKEMIQEAFIHSLIWLLGLGVIWQGTKKITGITKSLRDKNDHLLESEQRFRILSDTVPVLVWMSDETKGCTYFNKRWCDFAGRKEAELLGKGWAEDVHPDDLDECIRIYENSFDARLPFSIVYRLRRHDGEYRWLLDNGVPRWKDETEFIGYIGSCVDITERKQAEVDRQQLEQQFHQAQKLESLGVLAGGIAHDFNNILTVIMGHCYMAREDIIPEQEYKAVFQKIETAGSRATDLCRQMLTYAGRSPLVQTRVNLWLLVDEVVKMLQAAIKKNVTIELDLKRVVPEIKGDTGQIQQVIMNLIINAAEAIGENNGAIRVALTRILINVDQTETDAFGMDIQPGGYICLEVSDTGCGMDEETQQRIFEPFYTTKFTGRGLGMSAIKGIIKSHDSALQLESTPGVGTTFKVYFPVPQASGDAETTLPATVPLEEASGTILLVEDEQMLRVMGTELLEAMGFSALTAEDGSEALEIYCERGSEIDVILLDLIMPVMGGIEAYHELRKINTIVPIIICSGYGVESVEEIIGNDPHAGFVHKPYKPEVLQDVLVRMMKEETQGAMLAPAF